MKKHFDSFETFLLVIEFAAYNIIANFTILSGFIAQIVEHLFRSEVLTRYFLGVHETLSNRQKLVLEHLDVLGELALFLVQSGVLLLFFAEFGCSLEQSLEIIFVAFGFKEVNLGQKLLFFLFELGDFLFELRGIHRV